MILTFDLDNGLNDASCKAHIHERFMPTTR
jgi:hypothetical protein